MSGKVDVLFDNLGGPVLQMVRAGQLRALGDVGATLAVAARYAGDRGDRAGL